MSASTTLIQSKHQQSFIFASRKQTCSYTTSFYSSINQSSHSQLETRSPERIFREHILETCVRPFSELVSCKHTYQVNRILWYIPLVEHFAAMHISSVTAAMLLPFLAYAQTTTLTSTMTKTITVSEVVGTVTSTVGSHVALQSSVQNATASAVPAYKIASTGGIFQATSANAGTTATSSAVSAASATKAFTGAGATLSSSDLTVAGIAALVAAAML